MDKVQDRDVLFQGLKSLSESSFPKTCGACGRVYHTSDDFLTKSSPVSYEHSGLKESRDDNDKPILEIFRNCECGSTLMDFFSDRRDMSEAGEKRRKAFSKIQAMLVARGFKPEEARSELIKFMRGDKSPLLENLGILNHRPS